MRPLIALTAAFAVVRVASAIATEHPGYTDAYYYFNVAARLAAGHGLTADFVWNFLEAPGLEPLPVPSHRFWMPLATVTQAAGIATLGPLLGELRAAQAAMVAVAILIPPLAYAAARSIGAGQPGSLVAAAIAGLGGAFAPGWTALDGFGLAAVLGGAFFLAYGRAAAGDPRAGALAGALCGLLFLARAEAALLGLPLLWLMWRPGSRRAGAAASAVALVVGIAWLARSLSLGATADVLARSALLVRYEDFFALDPPLAGEALSAGGALAGARLAALTSNAGTLLLATGMLLAPAIALGVRACWGLPAVRAYAFSAALVYLAQSLVWTLHSTHGSYFHSLAAFVPHGAALAVVGASAVLGARPGRLRVAAGATLVGFTLLSLFAIDRWHAAFDAQYRARVAALASIPEGPFLAIDAAAWRWIAGRQVLVTPADGPEAAACVARAYGTTTLVLEPTHFSAYADLYREVDADQTSSRPSGDIKVLVLRAECSEAP